MKAYAQGREITEVKPMLAGMKGFLAGQLADYLLKFPHCIDPFLSTFAQAFASLVRVASYSVRLTGHRWPVRR